MKNNIKIDVSKPKKKQPIGGDDINVAVTFMLAIEIASENLQFMINKGVIKQNDKNMARKFLKFWKDKTKGFWNIFKDETGYEIVELVDGMEALSEILPMLSRLQPEEQHVISDFMKRLLECEFHIDNTIFDFKEVYLGFKEGELKAALTENLKEVVIKDLEPEFDNYNLEVNFNDYTSQIIWYEDSVYLNCRGSLYPFEECLDDIPLADLLKVNNYIYDKIQKRNGGFATVSKVLKGDTLYEVGRYMNYKDGIQLLQWRYTVGNNSVPVYGESPVCATETKRRRYIVVNTKVLYLDELKVENKDSSK